MNTLIFYILKLFRYKSNPFEYCNYIQKLFTGLPINKLLEIDFFVFMTLKEVEQLVNQLDDRDIAHFYSIFIKNVRSTINNTYRYKSKRLIPLYTNDLMVMENIIRTYQALIKHFPDEMFELQFKYIRGNYEHYSKATELVYKIK